jgi:hypothetical protein
VHDLGPQEVPARQDALLVAVEEAFDDLPPAGFGDRPDEGPKSHRLPRVPEKVAPSRRVEEPAQREREARVDGCEVEDRVVVEIPRARTAGHALEEADEVALGGTGAPLARDRQLGVDALDVEERLGLEVEDGRVLACVRDLEDAVADEESLVALAPEVAHLALEAEELGRDGADLLRREARWGRLEDVQRRGCDHALILRRENAPWRCSTGRRSRGLPRALPSCG